MNIDCSLTAHFFFVLHFAIYFIRIVSKYIKSSEERAIITNSRQGIERKLCSRRDNNNKQQTSIFLTFKNFREWKIELILTFITLIRWKLKQQKENFDDSQKYVAMGI